MKYGSSCLVYIHVHQQQGKYSNFMKFSEIFKICYNHKNQDMRFKHRELQSKHIDRPKKTWNEVLVDDRKKLGMESADP